MSMKTLWTFGDSWTEGLIQLPEKNTLEERANICFPQQIINRSDLFDSLTNISTPGVGNETILYRVEKNLNNFNEQDFVLISLSHHARSAKFNFIDDDYVIVSDENEHRIARRHPLWQLDMMVYWIAKQLKDRNIKHLFVSGFEPYTIFSKMSYSLLRDINFFKPEFVDNTLFDLLLGSFCKKPSDKEDLFTINPQTTRISPRTHSYSGNKYIAECNHPSPEGHILIADKLIECLPEYL